MLYKINNIVYVKTSKIINDIVIILYSSHTHTHTHTRTYFLFHNSFTKTKLQRICCYLRVTIVL